MRKLSLIVFASALLSPIAASAHEVYVLSIDAVNRAMATPTPNTFSAISGNEGQFMFWALVGVITVSTIFFATIFGAFEKRVGPALMRIKKYALPLARITAGFSTLSFGVAGALYGTELPFESLFGGFSGVMAYFYLIAGTLLIAGVYTRVVATLLSLVFVYATFQYGWYIFTYTDHIGVYLLLLILGGGKWSFDALLPAHVHVAPRFFGALKPFAFPLLRIFFGFGIMFASIYAKYIHNQLALEVVLQYDLTRFFPFDPLFVVLGALIIEFLAGLLFMLGIALRWTSLFLLFWLTLSLIYFQEAVWPHIILFGLCGVVFLHGYDRFSLEGIFMKKREREPVL